MAKDIRTLVVHRRHARLVGPRIGYSVEIPEMSFPDKPLPEGNGSLEEALGWSVPRKLFGRVDVIAPRGLVAPSAWERRYLSWLAAQLEVPLADSWEIAEEQAEDRPHVADMLRRICETDPWSPAERIPGGVIVRKAETHRLEAREAAFQIRRWVEGNGGAEACRDVLVLLPRGRFLRDLWLAEFAEVGVPAVGVLTRLLGETAIGGWALALARLVGWSEESPLPRHTLREALDAPFWSQKAAGRDDRPLKRDVLREIILDLRRPKITPSDWTRHLAAAKHAAQEDDKTERASQIEDIEAFSRRLFDRVAPGRDPIARFQSLLFGSGRKDGEQALDARTVARASKRDEAVDVVERIQSELERLMRIEQAHDGAHPEFSVENGPTLAGLLSATLAGSAIVDRRSPDPGVELVPYDLYDGRPCRHLIIAGLSESGFPKAPRLLADHEERWALALGLLGDAPPEDQAARSTRWVELDVSRQIDLARVAVSRCRGPLTLSYSTQGQRDEVVHPGGLLSLLVGGWTEKDWTQVAANQPYAGTTGDFSGVAVLRWAHEVPLSVADARSAPKAVLAADSDPALRAELGVLAKNGTCPPLAGLLDRLVGPDACADADAELESRTARPAGPYTGRLPGRIVPPDGYSPSSLENYGQCPHKYFFEKVLGLEKLEESSSFPNAAEVGSILHDALARAASTAISSTKGKCWDLSWDGDPKTIDGLVEAHMAEIEPEIRSALTAFHDAAPTTSRPYLEALGRRWTTAVRNWLRQHLALGTPGMRVVAAERAFGMEGDREPAVIEVAGRKIPLRGRIDRMDFDKKNREIVLRDYKSGAATGESGLRKEAAAGDELQLLLYALAVEALVEAGRLDMPGGSRVTGVSYEFLGKAKSAGLDLSEEEATGYLLDGEPISWRDIARAWTAFYTDGIESGRFDLAPRRCPAKAYHGGYCDFARYCPMGQGETPVLESAAGPEIVSEVTKDPREKKPPVLVASLPPASAAVGESAEKLREAHEQGQKIVADLDSEVFVAAGAGTGKTHSLVLRYLKALADEDRLPTEILCATFSRKAAAEMRHRVRQALLRPESDAHHELVAVIRKRPDRFRSIVLALSGAPISTLDSLAARIVREGEELKGDLELSTAEGVASSQVEGELEAFVSRRIMEGLENRDADVLALLDLVSVVELPDLLTPLVASGTKPWAAAIEKDTLEEELVERWLEPVRELEASLSTFFAGLDLKVLESALAASDASKLKKDKPDDAKREGIGLAVDALKRLRVKKKRDRRDFWQDIDTVRDIPFSVAKGRAPIFAAIESVFGEKKWFKTLVGDSQGLDLAMSMLDGDSSMERWAKTTALAIRIGGTWHGDFVEEIWASGQPRYQDMTARAREYLSDEKLRAGLKARLPFRHILVDESQDTSEEQVGLVTALAELTGGRLFWVGDAKQSIYRFRGAEVDVFEGLIDSAESRGAKRGTLRINFRSKRPLIEAVNDIFSALLPAQRAGAPVDRGSEVRYERLTWPVKEDETKAEPLVEMIAAPGEGWPVDAPAQEIGSVEDAIVRRIAAILTESGDRGGADARVAVLVNSWFKARTYQRLLTSSGVQAVVQGGGGLLSTREIRGLLSWLYAAVERTDLAFASVLKGPGLRMSDSGLYCLRRGLGIAGHDGRSRHLGKAALYDALDPNVAAPAWKALDRSLDATLVRSLLEKDAAVLARFRQVWSDTFERAGFRPAAELFREVIGATGLEAYWSRRDNGGRQAVANLQSFVDMVRDMEMSQGLTPQALLDGLSSIDDRDQRAATGLDAGASADVIVTTYWQAKGREWPVVVLPDIEDAKVGRNAMGGLTPERVLVPEDDAPFAHKTVEWHIGSAQTSDDAPLSASVVKGLDGVRDFWREPAERAELRRLLYVAMTRAKERLVLTGTFPPPTEGRAACELEDGQAACGIGSASTWADILGVCLDLKFDSSGKPSMGGRSLCKPNQILLCKPADVDPNVEGKRTPTRRAAGIDPALAKLWNPLPYGVRERLSPSQAEPAELVPEPIDPISWPEAESGMKSVFGTMDREGSAFHEVMEAWGYGGPQGIAFTRELVSEVLGELEMSDLPGRTERVDRLVALHATASERHPELFERLQKAAQAGDLYPELPISYMDARGRLVEGYVDLAWKDESGWHILDYKAGWQHPHAGDALTHEKLRHHYAQTSLYTEGLKTLLPAEPIVDFGVWYVACGLILRWNASSIAKHIRPAPSNRPEV